MTGDFLPRRQKASALSQAVTVLILLAVGAAAFFLLT
jgi:hypothetical protein